MSLLARGLPRDEFDVHVCVLTRTGPLESELRKAGISVTVIGKRWKVDPMAYMRLRRLVSQLRPDLIHTWLFAANAYGRAAGIACGVKCRWRPDRFLDPWKTAARSFSLTAQLARCTAKIVVNSHRRAGLLRGAGPAGREVRGDSQWRSTRSRTGGHAKRIPSPTSGFPERCFMVGLIGRLWRQKRVKDAIGQSDLLRVFRKDIHLLIIGDGPHRRQLERFRDYAVNRPTGPFFRASERRGPALCRTSTCFGRPAAYEGQSNSVMEAMAAGVPVIATDIPGTRDLVVHGETGYLVPTRNRAAHRPPSTIRSPGGLRSTPTIFSITRNWQNGWARPGDGGCSTDSASSKWSPSTPPSTAVCFCAGT